jgi:predicted dehydrogenase
MNFIHTIDFMRAVTGLEFVSVAANCDTFKTKVEVEDYIVVIMRLSNGAIGASRGATIVEGKLPPGGLDGDRIIGLDGQIFLEAQAIHLYLTKRYGKYETGKWHSIATEEPWGGRCEFVTDFSKAVLSGRKPPVTGLDGRRSLEVCLAAYRSGRTGRFVALPLKK